MKKFIANERGSWVEIANTDGVREFVLDAPAANAIGLKTGVYQVTPDPKGNLVATLAEDGHGFPVFTVETDGGDTLGPFCADIFMALTGVTTENCVGSRWRVEKVSDGVPTGITIKKRMAGH